jgi:hypothetical protein
MTITIDTIAGHLRSDPGRWPDRHGDYHADCPFCAKPAKRGHTHFRISAAGLCYCQVCQQGTTLAGLAEHLGLAPERTNGLEQPQTTYDYRDAHGVLAYQVVRYYKNGHKRFFQRHPDGQGGWINGMQGIDRVLYRLPEVITAIETKQRIFIVEGEKDVEALRIRGLVATTNVGGAGKWQPPYSQALIGADVVILPDNDTPGETHAQQVRQSLQSVAARARIVRLPDLPEKGDVSDWLAAGHTVDELEGLLAQSQANDPSPPATPGTLDDLPLLLPATELDRIPQAIPLIPGVLYVNTLHQFFGSPGCGKSFLMADIACIVAQHYRVVYVAAEAIEDYPARVNAWTAHYGCGVENLYFWREPLPLGNEGAVQRFIALVNPLRPALILFDPLADCMNGLDESGAGDMSIAIANLNTIRRATHAAIGIVHHTGWNDERERGSSLLRGACRVVAKIEMRDDGLIRMACIKKNQGEKFEPRLFRLVSGGTQGSVLPLPASLVLTGKSKPNDRMLRVMEALTTEPLRAGATHTQIKDDTQIPPGTLNRVLTSLTEAKLVWSFEDKRSRKYRLTDAGYEHLRMVGESSSKILEEGGGISTGFGSPSFNWFLCSSDQTGLPNAGTSTSFQSASTPEAPSSTFSSLYIKARVEELGNVEPEADDSEPIPVATTAELFADDTPPGLTPQQWERARWCYGEGRLIELGDIARSTKIPYTDLVGLIVKEAAKQ